MGRGIPLFSLPGDQEVRRPGIRCRTSSEIQRVVLTVLNSSSRQSSLVSTNVTSALEVFFINDMRYINPRFTYLLTLHYVQEVVHNHDVIWGAVPPGASVKLPPMPSDDRVRAPVIVRPAGKRYVTSIAASCCFSENNRPSLSPEQQQYRVTWRALRPCDGVTIHPLPLLLSRRRLVPRRRERCWQCIVYCSPLSVSWRGVVSNVGQINV